MINSVLNLILEKTQAVPVYIFQNLILKKRTTPL